MSAVTLLASGFLAVVLQKYGAGWMQWALPFLALPELTLSGFCATDPPAIPTFTAAESKALVDVTPGADFNSGLSKFSDLVQHLAWYELCHCTSGTLTALPAAPAPPAGTPVYTPPPAAVGAPCQSVHLVFSQDQTGVNFSEDLNAGGAWPANPTSLRLHFTTGGATGNVVFHGFAKAFNPSTGNVTFPSFPIPTAAMDSTFYYELPLGTTNVSINQLWDSGAGLQGFDIHADVFCNGVPPQGTLQPCCPPDPSTELRLDAILRMVTLLQRQLVPFAYISGTAHAGLTGSGSIAVQGLLGIRIDLTTIPTSNRQDSSYPPFVFDAGWVSMMDANGFIVETRAHAQNQVWIPPIGSDATLIGYSFGAGVVATITELQREP